MIETWLSGERRHKLHCSRNPWTPSDAFCGGASSPSEWICTQSSLWSL